MLIPLKVVSLVFGCTQGMQPQPISYSQDAREGGESPPLPRNCERSGLDGTSFGQGFSLFPRDGGDDRTTDCRANWHAVGKVAETGASQETGPLAF